MTRPKKRAFYDLGVNDDGENEEAYLVVEILSGKPFKSRGWPWIQACIRNVVGGKVEKAYIGGDGKLVIKTKNKKQTKQLLETKMFNDEPVQCSMHERMNTSRGTIYAPDLVDLSEEEVLGWLKEFGVTAVKQVRRSTKDGEVGTPLFVLTFCRNKVPEDIKLDYVRYKVRPSYPRPLMCIACGRFGHRAEGCRYDPKCRKCGIEQGNHDEAKCTLNCANCGSKKHTFLLVEECEAYKEQQEICKIKYEQDVSFREAERIMKEGKKVQPAQSFAQVVASRPTPALQPPLQPLGLDSRLRAVEDKVDRVIKGLEEKFERMLNMMSKVLNQGREVGEGEGGDVRDKSQSNGGERVGDELVANSATDDEGYTIVTRGKGKKVTKQRPQLLLGGIPTSQSSQGRGPGARTLPGSGPGVRASMNLVHGVGTPPDRSSGPMFSWGPGAQTSGGESGSGDSEGKEKNTEAETTNTETDINITTISKPSGSGVGPAQTPGHKGGRGGGRVKPQSSQEHTYSLSPSAQIFSAATMDILEKMQEEDSE